MEIHTNLGGEARGRRHDLEVLNKSAIVLITACWEAYCEDLAAEALQHIIEHASDSTSLPLELRKRVAKELKSDLNEIAAWGLADRGWQGILQKRLDELTAERNRKLNTPKTQNIIDLFNTALGIDDVSTRWRWAGMNVPQARAKLDKYVELRGAIAHRGQSATSCTKAKVQDYFSHVQRLVAKTGGSANIHVKGATGRGLW